MEMFCKALLSHASIWLAAHTQNETEPLFVQETILTQSWKTLHRRRNLRKDRRAMEGDEKERQQIFPPANGCHYACLDNNRDSEHTLVKRWRDAEQRSISLQSKREM